MTLNRNDCMGVVQDIVASAISSDHPKTYFFSGMPSARIIQRWTRASCTVALVTTVPTGWMVQDKFRQTEIAERGKILVDRCVAGDEQVGGIYVIGPKEFFQVVVIETDLLEMRYGLSSASTA